MKKNEDKWLNKKRKNIDEWKKWQTKEWKMRMEI